VLTTRAHRSAQVCILIRLTTTTDSSCGAPEEPTVVSTGPADKMRSILPASLTARARVAVYWSETRRIRPPIGSSSRRKMSRLAMASDNDPRRRHMTWIVMRPKEIDPFNQRGQPLTGRILRLAQGQSQGFIRAEGHREIFFHRADTDGTFNELDVGDEVTFELLEDRVSGARAIRVRKKVPHTRGFTEPVRSKQKGKR
jgi:cold shock CspA family protein